MAEQQNAPETSVMSAVGDRSPIVMDIIVVTIEK
jgi:hypothetical protein